MIRNMPKDMETEVTRYICPYHKLHPGDKDYAGCTCSTSYSRRKKE